MRSSSRQARIARVDAPRGIGAEAELVRERRGLGGIAAGEDELHARVVRQAGGNAAAEEAVGTEQKDACAAFGHISAGYADKLRRGNIGSDRSTGQDLNSENARGFALHLRDG